MEAREIIVIETKNQKKSVIMSAATTLGELKNDLIRNGIDYTNMTFFEGISKTELKTDASILPHDVPYKGQITNKLVFMLTNTNKKIKSGAMDRVSVYAAIKEMGLQNACINRFGKNYTVCKTADLINLIQDFKKYNTSEANIEIKEEDRTSTSDITTTNNNRCIDDIARAAISRLVNFLTGNGTIENWENEEIFSILNDTKEVDSTSFRKDEDKIVSPYSDDEIDDMFSDINID